MPKLMVNPDSPEAWEIELRPGANSLGRGAENDFPIEHPSVSSAHCVVTVMNSGVLIKDHGSINGTFVDNTLVEETVLLPGQLIRLGDVVMRFESDVRPAGKSISPATPAAQAAPNGFCKSHPKAVGRFYCAKCAELFCQLCVNTRMMAGQPAKFCRACGAECESLIQEARPEAPAFARLIGGAFSYPFKHDGLILLIAGTVFYVFMDFLAGRAFLFGIILMVFGTGYLISYMQRILAASAIGDSRMPDWPDFSSWADAISPCFQFLGTIAFSFAPAILLAIFAPADAPLLGWAYGAAIVLGCIYFPMAFTAVAMFDSLAALNPMLIVASILRIPAAYLLAVMLLLGAYAVSWMSGHFLEQLLPIPVLPGVISRFLGLYLMTVEMRILGLLYWTKKDELGWFRR